MTNGSYVFMVQAFPVRLKGRGCLFYSLPSIDGFQKETEIFAVKQEHSFIIIRSLSTWEVPQCILHLLCHGQMERILSCGRWVGDMKGAAALLWFTSEISPEGWPCVKDLVLMLAPAEDGGGFNSRVSGWERWLSCEEFLCRGSQHLSGQLVTACNSSSRETSTFSVGLCNLHIQPYTHNSKTRWLFKKKEAKSIWRKSCLWEHTLRGDIRILALPFPSFSFPVAMRWPHSTCSLLHGVPPFMTPHLTTAPDDRTKWSWIETSKCRNRIKPFLFFKLLACGILS